MNTFANNEDPAEMQLYTTSMSYKARGIFIFYNLTFYEQLKFHFRNCFYQYNFVLCYFLFLWEVIQENLKPLNLCLLHVVCLQEKCRA